jgi:hypothetical protein
LHAETSAAEVASDHVPTGHAMGFTEPE